MPAPRAPENAARQLLSIFAKGVHESELVCVKGQSELNGKFDPAVLPLLVVVGCVSK